MHRDPNSPLPNPSIDAAPYDRELNPLRNDPRDPRNRRFHGQPIDPSMELRDTRRSEHLVRDPNPRAAVTTRDPDPRDIYPPERGEDVAQVHVQMREKQHRQSGRASQRISSTGPPINYRISQPEPYAWRKTKKQGKWEKYITVSVWSVSALVLVILSTACFGIAFSATGWGYAHIVEQETPWEIFGLWQYCTSANECVVYFDINTVFHVSRAFAVLSLITNVTTLLDVISYICVKDLNTRPVGGSIIVLCFVSAACMVVTILTFVAGWEQFWRKTPQHEHWYIFRLHYAFGLAIAAGGLNLAAGLASILEVLNVNQKIKAALKQREAKRPVAAQHRAP